MRFNFSRNLTLALIAVLTVACFRETGVEVLPVTSTQVTEENDETLSTGSEAGGRVGDYVLTNASIQVVFNGDLNSTRRDYFLPRSYGALIDYSTQYEEFGSRDLAPRNDDGLNQMSQSVNMNRNTPVVYDRVEVGQIDARNAKITLYGGVMDLDGSLAAAGAPVSQNGRVIGCEVVTTVELADVPDASSDDIITQDPINYISVTTVISNTGSDSLPIFTVNDVTAVATDNYEIFIPYPEWGFDFVPGGDAYGHFAHFQPRQIYTTQYAIFSRVEEILRFRRESSAINGNDYIFTGKNAPGITQLASGEQMTFIRNMMAMNSGADPIVNNYSLLAGYNDLIDQLVENPSPGNPYVTNLSRFGTTVLTRNGRDGEITFSRIQSEDLPTEYYNGSAWVPLEEGRFYPTWGVSPAAENSAQDVIQAFVPAGRYTIHAQMPNTEPFFADFREVPTSDENGDPIVDENGDPVVEPEFFLLEPMEDVTERAVFLVRGLGIHTIGDFHEGRLFSVRDVTGANPRTLFGRVTLEDKSGSPVVSGTFPRSRQGNIRYVDSTSSAVAFLPVGDFDILLSRGPLYNVNITETTVNESGGGDDGGGDDGGGDDTVDTNIDFNLGRALTLDGYFSADFDTRSYHDPAGFIYEGSILLWSYAEDLDVVFFPDTNARPIRRGFFEAIARTLGSFDLDDSENDVDSFFDEVNFARATATVGRVAGDYPHRGRFALLNVPHEDQAPDFEVPLMETDPAEFVDRVRALDENIVVHVTRPRAPEGLETGFLTAIAKLSGIPDGQPIPGDNEYYTRTAATGSSTTWLGFDLMQLLAGNRYDEYLLARADWFNMLNAGLYVPVTGGSSQGQTKDLPMGAVRTYVAVSDTTLRDNDLSEFFTNAKAGNSFVTNGPLIEASVNGTSFGGTVSASGTATLTVSVEAAPWIPVSELRVILNGEVTQAKKLDLNAKKTTRFDETIELTLPAGRTNNWVVIEAGATLTELANGQGASGTFGRVNPGHLPIGFSNPIFINQ
ncbi:MAG: hypothetical protein QNK37_28025 [Acidobacteriota bacterium]|nr:hypothetical protein [Acidobacteriota bacterium]